mgnify:CR=1 FL=1
MIAITLCLSFRQSILGPFSPLIRVISMQNAELYRRGVVLPLDDDAEESLRSNDVGDATNARYLNVSDSTFFILWNIGLFQKINARCATLLDDYEEEVVEAASVDGITAAIDAVARNAAKHPDAAEFLEGLRNMAMRASRSSRPLLFVL